MKAAVIPTSSELIIVVNPKGEVKRDGLPAVVMPWLYAPWPEAERKGHAEIELEGKTLRALLDQISEKYKDADVYFKPINPRTNDVDFDYDIFFNEIGSTEQPGCLEVKLKDGDRVRIKMPFHFDG